MFLAAAPLSRMLGMPADLLRYAGASLIPFVAFVAWIATRNNVPRTSVRTVIVLNVAWVAASVLVLMEVDPNASASPSSSCRPRR